MPTRTRTRTRSELFGSVYVDDLNGGLRLAEGPIQRRTYSKSISDTYGKTRRISDGLLNPSPLDIMEIWISPLCISMSQTKKSTSRVTKRFDNVPLSHDRMDLYAPTGGWSSLEQTDTWYVAKLLSESNPFKYTVSIPIMISELLEATTLLSVARNNILTLAGSSHLNYQFGIRPLMADIRSLFQITKTIEAKILDFNRLVKRGGLRVKRFLSSNSQTQGLSSRKVGWSTYSTFFYYKVQPSYTSKVWGACRWRPTRQGIIQVKQLTSVNNAIRAVLDLHTPDLSTVWEMIPFSWLIDYFLNIGSTLQALEKSDLVEPFDICIMRTRTFDSMIKHDPESWNNNPNEGQFAYSTSASGGRYRWIRKMRSVHNPPNGYRALLSYGFMSEAQATNLAALLLSLARFR